MSAAFSAAIRTRGGRQQPHTPVERRRDDAAPPTVVPTATTLKRRTGLVRRAQLGREWNARLGEPRRDGRRGAPPPSRERERLVAQCGDAGRHRDDRRRDPEIKARARAMPWGCVRDGSPAPSVPSSTSARHRGAPGNMPAPRSRSSGGARATGTWAFCSSWQSWWGNRETKSRRVPARRLHSRDFTPWQDARAFASSRADSRVVRCTLLRYFHRPRQLLNFGANGRLHEVVGMNDPLRLPRTRVYDLGNQPAVTCADHRRIRQVLKELTIE
jgi:hypothetical protein